MGAEIPAAERALDVLTAMAQASGPVTAASLARDLGIPRSSVYQLLDVLVDRGFVVHLAQERRWTLGLTAFEVGSAYLRSDPLERLAEPLLRRLTRDAPVPVVAHLGVVRGHETVYLLKEVSEQVITTVTQVGVRLPAALTASGRAVLACLPKAQVRAQLSVPGAFTDRTGRGPRTLSALSALLDEERRQGFSTEEGFISEGFSSVAAPIRSTRRTPYAAIGLTFRSGEVPARHRASLVRAVMQCAQDVAVRHGG
jgi:DNA-binding IclR family transcriptional regulator